MAFRSMQALTKIFCLSYWWEDLANVHCCTEAPNKTRTIKCDQRVLTKVKHWCQPKLNHGSPRTTDKGSKCFTESSVNSAFEHLKQLSLRERKLWIWSHLLKTVLMKIFFVCAVFHLKRWSHVSCNVSGHTFHSNFTGRWKANLPISRYPDCKLLFR